MDTRTMVLLMVPALLGGVATTASAQPDGTRATRSSPAAVPRARVWLVPRADSVFVFLVDPPGPGGFTLVRTGAGGAADSLVTAPIRGERDPHRLAELLGDDLALVQRTVGAADVVDLARRLTSDRFVGTAASALHRRVALATGRLYVDTAAVPGRDYDYRVTYVGADGGPDPRRPPAVARVRVADVPMATPGTPRVEGRDDRATVSWTHPRYTGDARDQVIAFVVERADGDGAFRRVNAVPVLRDDARARLAWADTGLRVGVRYRYRVRALDVAGRQGAPGPEVAVATRDETAPAMPVGLRLEAGESRVALQWTPGDERDLAGHHVERALALDRPYVRLTRAPVTVSRPAFVDSAVTGPWQHFYRLVAVDSAGNESRPTSAFGASPTDRRPPPVPAALTATVARRRATLRWPASAGTDVLGYHVYRGATVDRLVRLTPKPISATQFVDSGFERRGLAPGAAYVVAVTAVDQSYNESERREARVEVPDDEPPRPPASVRTLDVRGRAIDLTWSASPSRDAAAYVVTRTGPDGVRRALGRFAAADARVLRDTAGLVHGRWYRYGVHTEDAAGNRSAVATDSLRFVDAEPPSPTRHARATLAPAGGVALEWEPVIDSELAGFHVYRATLPTGAGERLTSAPVAGTRWVDRAGRAAHWYVVTAVDRSGNESARSAAVQPVARRAAAATLSAAPRSTSSATSRARPAGGTSGAAPAPTVPGVRPRAPRTRDTGLR